MSEISMKPLILCVAAEASGDHILSTLLPHLMALAPHFRWEGIGGPQSVAAGLVSHIDPKTLAAHGFTEALRVLPATLRALKQMSALIPQARGLILVDAPELNMRLLDRARQFKIPVIYLAPPQVWAWRSWRIHRLRKVDWLGCLFEFEAEWFRAHGLEATCIGHPLVEFYPPIKVKKEKRTVYRLLLVPGSRSSTVKKSLPLMLDVALDFHKKMISQHTIQVMIAVSSWVRHDIFKIINRKQSKFDKIGISIQFWDQLQPLKTEAQSEDLIALCHAGTATLELGLAGIPYVAIAPLSPISTLIARLLIQVPYFSLPNLILGAMIFPELGPTNCKQKMITDVIVKLATSDTLVDKCFELKRINHLVGVPDYRSISRQIIQFICKINFT